MGKGDDKKEKGLSPEEVAKLERDKIDYQMKKLPPLQFADIFSNSNQAFDNLFQKAGTTLNSMVGSGYQNFANNPMKQLVSMLAGEQMGSMGGEMQQTAPVAPIQTPPPQEPPQQPQLSAYEARIQELMKNRGWSREDAIANQLNALGQNADYNNDGAVTNDEWKKFGQTPQGMAYINQHSPQQQQPQRPGMPNVNPNIGNLTPEQLSQIQGFQRYRV